MTTVSPDTGHQLDTTGNEHDPLEGTITWRFLLFHCYHPDVYDILVALTRNRRRQHPNKPVSISQIYEQARWDLLDRDTARGLNNNYRALYARLIMAKEPDLEGVFHVRERRSV